MNKLLDLADSIFSIFFPHLCLACSKVLAARNLDICLHCQAQLPFTTYHQDQENPFTERFWGRIPLQEGAACFYFTKGGKVQAMLHQLKYHRQKAIGLDAITAFA